MGRGAECYCWPWDLARRSTAPELEIGQGKVALEVGNEHHHNAGNRLSSGEMRLWKKAEDLTLQRGGSRGVVPRLGLEPRTN